MQYNEEVLEKFSSLPQSIREAFGGTEIFKKIRNLEYQFKVELSFLVMLVVVGELNIEDIEEYLEKKFGISKAKAKEINKSLQEDIFEPAAKALGIRIDEEQMQLPDEKDEREFYIRMFREDLLSLLKDDPSMQDAFNTRLFYLFNEDLNNFQRELVIALSANNEKLTSKQIVLDGKTVSPSVKNWLDDFVNKYGAEMFDNVTLSSYITDSENTRSLSDAERMQLTQVLLLYRNVAFFPESMPNDTGEGWEVIPIRRKESLSRVQQQISEDNSPEELRKLAQEYPENSLERRAIEEEISKIQN